MDSLNNGQVINCWWYVWITIQTSHQSRLQIMIRITGLRCLLPVSDVLALPTCCRYEISKLCFLAVSFRVIRVKGDRLGCDRCRLLLFLVSWYWIALLAFSILLHLSTKLLWSTKLYTPTDLCTLVFMPHQLCHADESGHNVDQLPWLRSTCFKTQRMFGSSFQTSLKMQQPNAVQPFHPSNLNRNANVHTCGMKNCNSRPISQHISENGTQIHGYCGSLILDCNISDDLEWPVKAGTEIFGRLLRKHYQLTYNDWSLRGAPH